MQVSKIYEVVPPILLETGKVSYSALHLSTTMSIVLCSRSFRSAGVLPLFTSRIIIFISDQTAQVWFLLLG